MNDNMMYYVTATEVIINLGVAMCLQDNFSGEGKDSWMAKILVNHL